MSATHRWQVLSRPECSLCDALLRELIDLLGEAAAAQIQIIDISDDPDLERKYGRRVPVVLVDGEFLCDYRLDFDRVRQFLSAD